MKRSGWSLVELMVALGLFSIVMAVVVATFSKTTQLTTLQNQRSAMQGQIQIIALELETILQRSTTEGVVYQAPSPNVGVLAIHCLQEGPVTSAVQFEPAYHCYLWDKQSKRLLAKKCPPVSPTLSVPPIDRPQAMAAADLTTLAANTQGARLLGEGVSNFKLSLEPGPLVRFTCELERPVPGRTTFDRRSVVRDLTLRNQTRT